MVGFAKRGVLGPRTVPLTWDNRPGRIWAGIDLTVGNTVASTTVGLSSGLFPFFRSNAAILDTDTNKYRFEIKFSSYPGNTVFGMQNALDHVATTTDFRPGYSVANRAMMILSGTTATHDFNGVSNLLVFSPTNTGPAANEWVAIEYDGATRLMYMVTAAGNRSTGCTVPTGWLYFMCDLRGGTPSRTCTMNAGANALGTYTGGDGAKWFTPPTTGYIRVPDPVIGGVGISVSTSYGLNDAVASAAGGEVITVAAGTYTKISITDRVMNGNVTVIGANPASKPIIHGAYVRGCSNWIFDGLAFDDYTSESAIASVHVQDCLNITIKNCSIYDPLFIATPPVSGGRQGYRGIYFLDNNRGRNWSDGCTAYNNTIYEMGSGAAATNCTYTTFDTNTTYYIWSDDAYKIARCDQILIARNLIHSLTPATDILAHQDAIQFLTAGDTRQYVGITVLNNDYWRGTGAAAQGLPFMGDEAGTGYGNVLIDGNRVWGGQNNGISLGGGVGRTSTNAIIRNNIVQAFTGQASELNMEYAGNVTLTNNSASSFQNIGGTSTILVDTGNDWTRAAIAVTTNPPPPR